MYVYNIVNSKKFFFSSPIQPRLQANNQTKSLLVSKTVAASSVAASSPATVTALQSKFPVSKTGLINSSRDQVKRNFSALR